MRWERTFHAISTLFTWACKKTGALSWSMDIKYLNRGVKSTVQPETTQINDTLIWKNARGKSILVCSHVECKTMRCDLTLAMIHYLV
jgi:hypothetical protein